MRNAMRPFYKPGESVTAHAKTAVTGRRFVDIDGARTDGNISVSHKAGDAIGVAAYDAPAGEKVTTYLGGVLEVQAASAVTAGQYVKPDGTGQAIPAATKAEGVGRAVDDIAAGATGPIDFGR